MKTINLTKDKYTIVDDEDFEWLNNFKWCFDRYATRNIYTNKEKIKSYMHREILKKHAIIFEGKFVDVDHINQNKLDNRKQNLRIATRSKNMLNVNQWKHNTSGYKGVTWDKKKQKWISQIKIHQKNIYLGAFINKQDAAKAYQVAILNEWSQK